MANAMPALPMTQEAADYQPSAIGTFMQMLLGPAGQGWEGAKDNLRQLKYQQSMRPYMAQTYHDYMDALHNGGVDDASGQGQPAPQQLPAPTGPFDPARALSGWTAPAGAPAQAPMVPQRKRHDLYDIGDPASRRWLGAAAALGMPGAKEQLDIAKEAYKANEMQVGPDNVYRRKFDSSYGGQPLVGVEKGQLAIPGVDGAPEGVTNAPGAVAAQARSAAAQSLGTGLGTAATNLDTINVDGVPQTQSRLRWLQQSGPLDGVLDGVFGNQGPVVPQQAQGGPGAAPATPAAAAPVQAAPAPPVRPVQRGAARGGPINGVSADTQAYRTANATDAAGRFKALQDAGAQASGAKSRLILLEGLLKGVEGGSLSSAGYEIASGLNSLGIRVDPKLPNKDAAAVLQRSMATEAMKNPDTGANMFPKVTNFEYENALKQVPGLAQSAAGRHVIVQMRLAEQGRIQDLATKARAWQDKFGRLDAADSSGKHFDDYLNAWSAKHPLYSGLKLPGQR